MGEMSQRHGLDHLRPSSELESKLRIGMRYGQLAIRGKLRRGFVEILCDCGQRGVARPADLLSGRHTWCESKAHYAWTYVLWAPKAKLIKVGSAVVVEKRTQDIQSMSPVPLRLILVCRRLVETDVHWDLGKFRKHGEWFRDVAIRKIEARGDFERVHVDMLDRVGTAPMCVFCGSKTHSSKGCGQ